MNLLQTHPSHITWELPYEVLHNPGFFNSQIAKNSVKTESILIDLGYSIYVEDLTDELLDRFSILYADFLTHKPRGTVFPIKERIEDGRKTGISYSILSFYDPKKNLIGGLIMSENSSTGFFTTTYKVLPHQLPERKRFPESIAYAFTYKFYRLALEKNVPYISHGRDRNPYGFYSNIGLGLFKMRAQCRIRTASEKFVSFKNEITYTTDEDMLLWLGDTPETPVTKAILITKLSPEGAKEKYKPLFLLENLTIEIWDHAAYIASLPKETV